MWMMMCSLTHGGINHDVLFITCDFSPSLIAFSLSASPEAYSSHNGVHTLPGETLH